MSRIVVRWAFLASIAVALLALSAWAKDFRWGYVDTERLMREYPPAVAAKDSFEARMTHWQTEVDRRRAEFDSILADAQRKSSTMSAARKQQIQEILAAKSDSLQSLVDTLQRKAATLEDSLLSPIMDALNEVVFVIAARDTYEVIYDAERAGIVYADTTHDVTTAVLREALIRLNR